MILKKSLFSGISAFAISTGAAHAQSAQETLESLIQESFSSTIATTSILTDSEVITFGVMNFDPHDYIDLEGDEFGNAESVETRSNLAIYTLPWQWKLSDPEDTWQNYLKVRLGYVEYKRDVLLYDTAINADKLKDQTFDFYGEYGWRHPLNKHWTSSFGTGLHVIHYKNKYRYRSSTSEQLAPFLDGLLLNTKVTALMAEPIGRLSYNGETRGIPWAYRTALSYSAGQTISTDNDLQDTDVEAWRWSNGVVFHFHMPEVYDTANQLRLLARRVDIRGDVVSQMGTQHYYEVGVGWLLDIKDRNTLLENIGIGLSLNVGSSLSGGSVVLLYNEEY